LLEEAKVAVVPGIGFGNDDYVRLSYACSMENIKKGLDRIAEFVGKLK
jgi:aspartate aminotransferase